MLASEAAQALLGLLNLGLFSLMLLGCAIQRCLPLLCRLLQRPE